MLFPWDIYNNIGPQLKFELKTCVILFLYYSLWSKKSFCKRKFGKIQKKSRKFEKTIKLYIFFMEITQLDPVPGYSHVVSINVLQGIYTVHPSQFNE